MLMRTIFLLLMAALIALHATAAATLQIATFAGNGRPGYSGDAGPAAVAQLNNPFGIARGPDGALYICDTDNHRIRRVNPDGLIETVAGAGSRGYSGDGGPARKAELNEPYEIRFDPHGNIFFVEMRNHIVRRVDAKTGLISTVAGTGQPGFGGDGGPAAQAVLRQPHSIQFGLDGHLYICDIGNHRIRRVDLESGIISTFAGTGERGQPADGGPIQGAPLNGPRAIDFDRHGNLWLALREGNAVYKLDLQTQTIHHIAGTGRRGFTGDGGPATAATFAGPKGISAAPDGHIYLADTENHAVRRINLSSGTVERIAGDGQRGDGPEGDPLTCRMARPHGIFVDRDGTIFVGDSEAHRVRVIRPAAPGD
jgi:streptogramin lyase